MYKVPFLLSASAATQKALETSCVSAWINTGMAKVTTLTNCKDYYENKIKQRHKQQRTINDWRDQYTQLRSGRYIGANIRQVAVPTQSKFTSDDDSEEAEFNWEPHYDDRS